MSINNFSAREARTVKEIEDLDAKIEANKAGK